MFADKQERNHHRDTIFSTSNKKEICFYCFCGAIFDSYRENLVFDGESYRDQVRNAIRLISEHSA